MAVAALHKTRGSGYKQSEVGAIPYDWEVVRLSSLTILPIQNGVFTEPVRKGRGCKLINVIDLYSALPIDTSNLERFDATKAEIARFGVAHGDLFFTRSSLTADGIAHCNIYNRVQNENIVFDCHIIRVRTNVHTIDPFFLARYCSTEPARRYFVANAKTTTMTTVDQAVIGNLPVPRPSLSEQLAIASALSDVDALIGSLEKLIAKKRDVKQAAMQQLLTGKKRLPGYTTEWEDCVLSAKGRFAKGRGITKGELVDDGIPCIRYGEIYTHHQDYVRTCFSHIPPHIAQQSERLQKGDLLFTGSGETAEEIGKCIAFLFDNEVYAGGDIVIFRPQGQNSMYLGYLMNHASIVEQKARMAQGDAVVHISANSLGRLKLRLPPLDEQTAIAAVLFDVDAEINALERRRDKVRDLKQGMMQQLLTGKIRLV